MLNGWDVFLRPFYVLGVLIWNLMLRLIAATSGATPEMFSTPAWSFVTDSLYPLFAAIGATLLNVFFYIGYIRQASNLKQGMTMEIFVECCLKVIFGNVLIQYLIQLVRYLFAMSGIMSIAMLDGETMTFIQTDMDAGASFFYMTFGIVFFAVCLVCAATIFLTVYGRFLQLYLLVLAAPIAISTIPGGIGVSSTAAAWIKTFLGKTFSIVFIALSITIATKMCEGVDYLTSQSGFYGEMDGFFQAIQNIFTMVLMTASVKGMDVFMRRTFGL